MSKIRISQKNAERCLLTDIAPYETPILFSNWGSYNYFHSLRLKKNPPLLQKIFKNKLLSVPYKFRIKKDALAYRTLSLIHPKSSESVVSFYAKNDILITKYCSRSLYSLRSPSRIAKFYTSTKNSAGISKAIEEITADTAYASSYFKYNRFSHLYKFFDSDDFTELEKRFQNLLHLDITKCFPSIYTHSISWAIKGKTATKESLGGNKRKQQPFDAVFDQLMQDINYKETNGILIGPELSRIFAEVILQRIDSSVFDTMSTNQYSLGEHYWCCRYIDDYFLFFNSADVKAVFLKSLNIELEQFKLYLGSTKEKELQRPFISDVSAIKIKYSEYLSALPLRIGSLRAERSHTELNRLRAILKGSTVPFSSVSNFLMAGLLKQFSTSSAQTNPDIFHSIYVYIDLIFHVLRMDLRVSSSYKIAGAIIEIIEKIAPLNAHERSKILDKIAFELHGALESANSQESAIECLNLLIAQREISHTHPPSATLLHNILKRCRSEHNDEYSTSKRLTYFEIVSLIYVIRDAPQYSAILNDVINDAQIAIDQLDPRKYAETAYTLIDLVACPYINRATKDRLISGAMKHEQNTPSQANINTFYNKVSKHRWYFDWNLSGDLKTHLKKKRLLLAY